VGRESSYDRSQRTKSSTSVLRHIQTGKPLETGKSGVGVLVLAQSPDEPVDAVRVGPVRLDRDGVKPFSTIRRW